MRGEEDRVLGVLNSSWNKTALEQKFRINSIVYILAFNGKINGSSQLSRCKCEV